MALGAVLALLADYLDPRIKTLQQAEAVTGLPAIAAVPMVGVRELARLAKRGGGELQRYDPKVTRLLPPALQPPLMRYAIEQPTSIFAEAMRAVRLAVQRAARGKRGQIVMVTSAVDGEGKTTLAANLALSFATIGVRTVLVEGDLRHPELTRSLCPRARAAWSKWHGRDAAAPGDPGRSEHQPRDPAGAAAENAALLAEFVSSDAMSAMLAELRKHYDVVIVDAPPLMPLVDGRMLAEHADRIMLAARWDRTPQDLLASAVENLDYVRDRVIGTVLTQVDLQQAGLYDRYSNSVYFRPYDVTCDPTRSAQREQEPNV